MVTGPRLGRGWGVCSQRAGAPGLRGQRCSRDAAGGPGVGVVRCCQAPESHLGFLPRRVFCFVKAAAGGSGASALPGDSALSALSWMPCVQRDGRGRRVCARACVCDLPFQERAFPSAARAGACLSVRCSMSVGRRAGRGSTLLPTPALTFSRPVRAALGSPAFAAEWDLVSVPCSGTVGFPCR